MTRAGTNRNQDFEISLNHARYVQALYQDLLGKPPTFTDLKDWTAKLLGGTQRATLVGWLLNSDEYRRRRVFALYVRFMGKHPSDLGLRDWTERFARGISEEELIAEMVCSTEYQSQHGEDTTRFVNALLRGLHGKSPTRVEVMGWVGLLDSATLSREDLALELQRDPAYRIEILRKWVGKHLQRIPDQEMLRLWSLRLEAGESAEDIQKELLGGHEYYRRASWITKPQS